MTKGLEELVFGKDTIDSSDEEINNNVKKERKPLWIDPDDALLMIQPQTAKMINVTEPISGEQFSSELSERFFQSYEHVDIRWTDIDKAQDITIDSSSILSKRTQRLPSDRFVITRRADFKGNKNGGGYIDCDTSPDGVNAALLGSNSILRVCSYSKERTAIVHEVLPYKIHRICLMYSFDGSRIFIGCKRGMFQSVDSNGGNVFETKIPNCKDDIVAIKASSNVIACVTNDSVHFFNQMNRAFLGTVKTSESGLSCGAFNDDSSFFVVAGDDGRGHVIDTSTFRSIALFQHNERMKILSLDIRGDIVAMGNESGILSLFELDKLRISQVPNQIIRPTPILQKFNLTTFIDTVKFNPTGEFLVFASSSVQNALKVLHVSSGTVFSNWPTSQTPLHYVRGASISSLSDTLIIANNKAASQWEIPFYRKENNGSK